MFSLFVECARGKKRVSQLAHVSQQLPGQVSSMESRLAELQLRLGGLKHLQPMWVRFSDLRDKQIPNQKEVVNLAESKLNILENEASPFHDCLSQPIFPVSVAGEMCVQIHLFNLMVYKRPKLALVQILHEIKVILLAFPALLG